MSLSSHQSARMKNDEWLTPPEILAKLGSFDLDPCAPIVRPWAMAAQHYTREDNGLSKEWRGRVWLNPPFGREAVKWLRRLADHGNGIALVPARTETAMFNDEIWERATSVLFMRARPHFHYVDGTRAKANSGAPIALVAYDDDNFDGQNSDALYASGLGVTVRWGAMKLGAYGPWTAVTARLPRRNTPMLVTYRKSQARGRASEKLFITTPAILGGDGLWHFLSGAYRETARSDGVTHWMPIPRPFMSAGVHELPRVTPTELNESARAPNSGATQGEGK